jgi:hypothetical protein
MSANAFNVGRVGRLIRMLASDSDGECLAAARALGRALAAQDLSFHDLGDCADRLLAPVIYRRETEPKRQPEPGPADRKTVAQWLLDHGRLSAKERVFVASLLKWRAVLTQKQGAWFEEICDRERARAHG